MKTAIDELLDNKPQGGKRVEQLPISFPSTVSVKEIVAELNTQYKGISFKRLLEKAQRTANMPIFDNFRDMYFIGDLERQVSQAFARVLSIPERYLQAIEFSLIKYRNEKLDTATLRRMYLKLNANKRYILKNTVIPPWDKVDQWAPLYVTDVLGHSKTARGARLLAIEVMPLLGLPAGELLAYKFPVRFIRYFLKEIGFPVREKIHEAEIFNTMFLGRLSCDKVTHKYTIVAYEATSGQRKWNRDLFIDRKKCWSRRGYHCSVCPNGADKCGRAVRKESFVVKECLGGHQGFFEHNSDSQYCLACRDKFKRNKKEKKELIK